MVDEKTVLKLFMAVALLILATVHIMQYGFGILPCQLCLWQRLPWGAAIIIALCAYVFGKPRLGLWAIMAMMGAGAMLAFYHIGVERQVWLSSCGGGDAPTDPALLLEWLQNQPVIRCDAPAFRFMRLSLAEWNMIASSLFFVMLVFYLARSGKEFGKGFGKWFGAKKRI